MEFPAIDLPPGSVAVVLGTRPEIVKLAHLIAGLGNRARVIHTGQHYDYELSAVFFEAFGIPEPAVFLGVGGRTRAGQIAAALGALDELFASEPPRVVVVQGDTNTTLAGALAANAHEIPIVHVEAGLRSRDRRMPEEHNRVVADHLADLCLAPTDTARRHLLAEQIPDERIEVTGNTVVDVAARLVPDAGERAALLDQLGVCPADFALATFHRPENVDDVERLGALLDELSRLPLPVVFPVHPRTRQRICAFGLEDRAEGLLMVPPFGYRAFLGLAAECAFLLSDSGGVQEEASVVKRPAIVVRRSTERPEVVGTFAVLVPSVADLARVVDEVLTDLPARHRRLSGLPSPYGDGRASQRCVEHILQLTNGGR